MKAELGLILQECTSNQNHANWNTQHFHSPPKLALVAAVPLLVVLAVEVGAGVELVLGGAAATAVEPGACTPASDIGMATGGRTPGGGRFVGGTPGGGTDIGGC